MADSATETAEQLPPPPVLVNQNKTSTSGFHSKHASSGGVIDDSLTAQ